MPVDRWIAWDCDEELRSKCQRRFSAIEFWFIQPQ